MDESETPAAAALARLEIPPGVADDMTDDALVLRLVDAGMSRLSAERVVAVTRGGIEPGRARRHTGTRMQGQ